MGDRPGHPFRGNQYTTYGRTTYGPAALTAKMARAAGYTEGPYYHSTNAANRILKRGFRSKGYEAWDINSPGGMEEMVKWGKGGEPVFFGRTRSDVKGYGKQILSAMAKPGKLKSAGGKTLAGGLYTVHPQDVVPISKKATHRILRRLRKR